MIGSILPSIAIITLSAFIGLCASSRPTESAEFYLEPVDETGDIATVTLYGKIEEGDAERLLDSLLLSIKQNGHYVDRINLFSPGGDAAEGIRLGRVIKRFYIATEAPTASGDGFLCYGYPGTNGQPFNSADCICASACAIAWLGGIERRGIAGFHRVYSVDPEMSAARAREVRRFFDQEIETFLKEAGAPRFVQDLIEYSGPKELSFPTPRQLALLQESFDHFTTAYANCQSFDMSADDKETYFAFETSASKSALSSEERRVFDRLSLAYDQESKCHDIVRRRELLQAQEVLREYVQ